MTFEKLRIDRPGRWRLSSLDPSSTPGIRGGKDRAERRLPPLREELDGLQERFYADGRRGLLVVLQGMDTAGKDGTIRHVFEGVNPQGVRVAQFREPTPLEASHDFLWRVHAHVPAKGEVVIFNRSHYEDVLVSRVHGLVPRSVWTRRYDAINDFERELESEGTKVLKFFLHIDRDEQGERLRARRDDPTKRWKLSPADATERAAWPAYMAAYEEMVRRTSTPSAPWYVVPSDRKWYRNLVVSTVLVETLRGLDLRYPKPNPAVAKLAID